MKILLPFTPVHALVAILVPATVLGGDSQLAALPPLNTIPSNVEFHGHYQHRSRGREVPQPSELWLARSDDGGLYCLAELPFTGSRELAIGTKQNSPAKYQVRNTGQGQKPGYAIDMDIRDGEVRLTRRGIRTDFDAKPLKAPAKAFFDPNSRPDSYCAANILLRKFRAEPKATAFRAYDWDNSGEGLVDYELKVECTGKEKVQVPAGTFEASHVIVTQTSSADTWFKKRAGHKTDFWVLGNDVIVRILRQREPYELVLLDYDTPTKLPGLVNK